MHYHLLSWMRYWVIYVQLDASVKEINKQHDLRAVILKSSEEGYFCAGADLK